MYRNIFEINEQAMYFVESRIFKDETKLDNMKTAMKY